MDGRFFAQEQSWWRCWNHCASSRRPRAGRPKRREIQVLELIAQGLSNCEISERLFLALDTVKGHNRRIYGKLGVKNRTHAVSKARALNILPPQ